MTTRTKRLLGSLVVLALLVGGFGTLWSRGRGTDEVAISGAPPITAADPGIVATIPVGAASAPAPTSSVKALKKAVKRRAETTTAKPAAAQPKPKPATTRAAASSVKKGASIFGTPSGITGALSDAGVSWTYNWAASPNGVSAPKGVEFVPMIWGAASTDAATLARAKQNGSTLLGFNEPDFADQANLSVDRALDLWPKLEATGLRLGSPAVAWGADQDGKWLDQFMTGAAQRGYRVDFITLHWYGGDFDPARATSQLRSYITATYAKYHKPIWVTEYALMNFGGGPRLPSAEVQADFVTRSTAMLEGLAYVERYAWFALPTSTDGTDGTGLYRPGGIPTLMGKAYRAAG